MKKRIKSFKLFKESYLHEFEDDLLPDELEADHTEEHDENHEEDAEFDALETEHTEEEHEEEEDPEIVELKEKINAALEANYLDILKDIVNGVINELGDEDKDKVMSALKDCVCAKVEHILMTDEEAEHTEEHDEEEIHNDEDSLEVEETEEEKSDEE